MSKDKKQYIKSHKLERTLKCRLTDEEIRDASDSLAKSLSDVEAATSELQSIKSQFKSKIDRLNSDVLKFRNLVSNKYEYRTVRCIETYNLSEDTYVVVREDNGEIVEERQLRGNERQMEFFGEREEAQEEVEDEPDESATDPDFEVED